MTGETDAHRIMAEALSDPRPVSIVAVDGVAVNNIRSSANQIQVSFLFLMCHAWSVKWSKYLRGKIHSKLSNVFYFKKNFCVFWVITEFSDFLFKCLEKEIWHVVLARSRTNNLQTVTNVSKSRYTNDLCLSHFYIIFTIFYIF